MTPRSFRRHQLFLLIACLATPAHGQDKFADVELASRTLTFEGRQPFGGLSEFGWLSQHWSVNTFYTVFRGDYPDQTKFWILRRVTGNMDGGEAALWADSRSCPAVEQTLIAMERLPAVRPDAPQLGEEDLRPPIFDGAHHTLWNAFARSGERRALVGLEITGNVDSPVAEWWSANLANLADCWRETPPL